MGYIEFEEEYFYNLSFDLDINSLHTAEEDQFLCVEPIINILEELMSVFNQLTLDQFKIQNAVINTEEEYDFCYCGKIADYYYNGKDYCDNCIDSNL